MTNATRLLLTLTLLISTATLPACGGGDASASASPQPTKDTYYNKLGIWDHDIDAFKKIEIPTCAEGLSEDPDFTRPPADQVKLRHIATLFGECHRSIAARHLGVGLLRVNDLMLGTACVALGATDADDDLPEACNIESALPKPR